MPCSLPTLMLRKMVVLCCSVASLICYNLIMSLIVQLSFVCCVIIYLTQLMNGTEESTCPVFEDLKCCWDAITRLLLLLCVSNVCLVLIIGTIYF